MTNAKFFQNTNFWCPFLQECLELLGTLGYATSFERKPNPLTSSSSGDMRTFFFGACATDLLLTCACGNGSMGKPVQMSLTVSLILNRAWLIGIRCCINGIDCLLANIAFSFAFSLSWLSFLFGDFLNEVGAWLFLLEMKLLLRGFNDIDILLLSLCGN